MLEPERCGDEPQGVIGIELRAYELRGDVTIRIDAPEEILHSVVLPAPISR